MFRVCRRGGARFSWLPSFYLNWMGVSAGPFWRVLQQKGGSFENGSPALLTELKRWKCIAGLNSLRQL